MVAGDDRQIGSNLCAAQVDAVEDAARTAGRKALVAVGGPWWCLAMAKVGWLVHSLVTTRPLVGIIS